MDRTAQSPQFEEVGSPQGIVEALDAADFGGNKTLQLAKQFVIGNLNNLPADVGVRVHVSQGRNDQGNSALTIYTEVFPMILSGQIDRSRTRGNQRYD